MYRGVNVAGVIVLITFEWSLVKWCDILGIQVKLYCYWYTFLISDKFHRDFSHFTKPLPNKCRSSCMPINKSVHVNMTRYVLGYHGRDWGLQKCTFRAWISNHIHYNVRDEITYLSPNFIGGTEVWERISNFIPHSTGHVITYPCWS